MIFLKLVAALFAAMAATGAMASDATERKFVREGMHESEVILKIGKPDHEAFIRSGRGRLEEKSWSYFPHYQDSETLTIITLRAGVVASIERKIVR